MDLITYLLIFVIVVALILILFAVFYNKIQTELLKLKEIETELDDTLRNKYDLLYSIGEIIKFDMEGFVKLKNEELTSFEFSRGLKEVETNIIKLKDDKKKNQKNNAINHKTIDLKNLNIKLCAQEKYYNNVITSYNNLVLKFPSNVVAKIMRLSEKKYFDNKDLTDDIENDFKI